MIKSTILPGYHKAINGRDIIYTDHINLAAAKNGGDSAAVTLLSDENAAGVQICVGEPPAGVTCDMFLEHMLVANGEMWPDPLTEFSGELTLTAGEYQSVLLRFDCSDDAKAGDYSIPVIVKKGTERIAELTIELRILRSVMNSLPRSASMGNNFFVTTDLTRMTPKRNRHFTRRTMTTCWNTGSARMYCLTMFWIPVRMLICLIPV